MTEADWLNCVNAQVMCRCLLHFVPFRERELSSRGHSSFLVSERKRCLILCACCARVRHLVSLERVRALLGVVERVADGLADAGELEQASREAYADWEVYSRNTITPEELEASCAILALNHLRAEGSVSAVLQTVVRAWAEGRTEQSEDYEAECAAESSCQAAILRDVIGNPFRQPGTDSQWLTWQGGTVVQLAQTIYDERLFERLPILADALEDAGCVETDILNHCRQPGEHVRGCWVLDLLLGKR